MGLVFGDMEMSYTTKDLIKACLAEMTIDDVRELLPSDMTEKVLMDNVISLMRQRDELSQLIADACTDVVYGDVSRAESRIVTFMEDFCGSDDWEQFSANSLWKINEQHRITPDVSPDQEAT